MAARRPPFVLFFCLFVCFLHTGPSRSDRLYKSPHGPGTTPHTLKLVQHLPKLSPDDSASLLQLLPSPASVRTGLLHCESSGHPHACSGNSSWIVFATLVTGRRCRAAAHLVRRGDGSALTHRCRVRSPGATGTPVIQIVDQERSASNTVQLLADVMMMTMMMISMYSIDH